MTGQHDVAPLSGIDGARNRGIVTERLGWPVGALEECEKAGGQFPGWYAWWALSPHPDPGFQLASGATLSARHVGDALLYGRTRGGLAERIAEEIARGAARDA